MNRSDDARALNRLLWSLYRLGVHLEPGELYDWACTLRMFKVYTTQ